ncbi:hypothetical protein [Zobellia sp. B3R18]|uniref:hypothetical protein n=1 Tax=Zobellia sp. B3R18 TaxID=2841568 RepID=UPI001C0749B5|nr:hypothetical protein [Zobellia sp. B3R18]MBU2973800.1 hypothetical protein [Zobellia sp. B3R18]
MPIIKSVVDSSLVYYPKTNYTIAKYLDLTKFISLLSLNSLFFCRLDKLEDHFEGTTSKFNIERRKRNFKKQRSLSANLPKLSEEELDEKVKISIDADRKFKSVSCVCCWNKYDSESSALWKIYSDFNKGIMIKSNIHKIENAFEHTPENLSLSEVNYINYDTDSMPHGNRMHPITHKHEAYKYENEIRLIHVVKYGHGFSYDWNTEKFKYGKNLIVNLNDLISEIVISPLSADWYIDLIKDICSKYGLQKKIRKSDLAK